MDIEHHNIQDQETCIEVKDVSFSYGSEMVLEHVSFTVKRGEYVGIIGPNGGGKTTLLKLLLGLLEPASGEVRIFGQNIYALKKERGHIGYVPQRVAQIDSGFPATVEEVVMSGRTARVGLFRKFTTGDVTAVDEALKITDMQRYRKTLIGSLSGGEKQRVFIARALAGQSQILILDEPTVGVDASAQEHFYAFLAEINIQYGLTVILVSHDIDVVSQEVKTLLCINRELVCSGPAKVLLTEEYLQKLYGRRVNPAFHGH